MSSEQRKLAARQLLLHSAVPPLLTAALYGLLVWTHRTGYGGGGEVYALIALFAFSYNSSLTLLNRGGRGFRALGAAYLIVVTVLYPFAMAFRLAILPALE